MATHTASNEKRQWVLSVLERYEVPLVRFVKRLLGDEDAARDVVQHAFLRLCDQSPEQLRDRVAPWLFTVCRNRAVDWARARRRMASLHDPDLYDGVSREPDPAVVAEQHDLYARLNGAVEQLPAKQRESLALWVEGFGYREIAHITGHSEGNVRVLVHRALKHLRQHPVAHELLAGLERDEPPHPRRPTAEVAT